jgi:hypothetical protein
MKLYLLIDCIEAAHISGSHGVLHQTKEKKTIKGLEEEWSLGKI